jgi:FkbM family methyltransferase
MDPKMSERLRAAQKKYLNKMTESHISSEIFVPPCNIGPAGTIELSQNGGAFVACIPGKAGHVIYGPYINLTAGLYRARLFFNSTANSRFYGRVEVTAGTLQNHKILAYVDIENCCLPHKKYLDAYFLLTKSVNDIEFRVQSFDNSEFSVMQQVIVSKIDIEDIFGEIPTEEYREIILWNLHTLISMLNSRHCSFRFENKTLIATCNATCINTYSDFKVFIKRNVNVLTLAELLLNDIYNFNIQSKCIVVDIGSNVGDSTLFFASLHNVVKVYSYEPFKSTFVDAIKNYALNPSLSQKIISYNVGLSSEVQTLSLGYNAEESGGMRTSVSNLGQGEGEHVKIVNAADELLKILEAHPKMPLVVKIDCEGAEFKIFKAINDAKLLPKISVILMELHKIGGLRDFSTRDLLSVLSTSGFTFINFREDQSIGMLYAFNTKI